MVINEEGKLRSLPPTIAYIKDNQVIDYVCGNAVFLRYDDNGDFCSLRDEDFPYIKHRYGENGMLTLQEEQGLAHHVLLFKG